MRKRVLIFICSLLCGCFLFSDSRSTVTIHADESFKYSLQMVHIYFGSEKRQRVNLNPGESFTTILFPTSINSHLDFQYDVGTKRYYWASWESELFGKTFADKFFKQHRRYQIIIDLKADQTLLIKVYRRHGLFSKELLVQGLDKIQDEEILEQAEYP